MQAVLMAGIQVVYWEFPEKSMATDSMTYKQIFHSFCPLVFIPCLWINTLTATFYSRTLLSNTSIRTLS